MGLEKHACNGNEFPIKGLERQLNIRVRRGRVLHTDAFTHRRFYIQKLLRTEAFTHKHFSHTET